MAVLTLAIDDKSAVEAFARFERGSDRVSNSARKIDSSVGTVQTKFRGLSSSVLSVQSVLGSLFGTISAGLALRGSAGLIGGFEETVAVLQGIAGAAGATDRELNQLEKTARLLGATSRFTARESADGLLFLARAGFTARESIDAIGSTLNLASVGLLGLGEAADFASNIVAQFGLRADETARVVDTLVITSNRSNTNIRQLAEALVYAGPIAGALGRSVEETAAAIGVLGDRGLQASMAGTGLRKALLDLAAPTNDAVQIFRDLGIEMSELDPTANSLVSIFDRLSKSEFGVAEAGKVFGSRAAAAVLVLIDSVARTKELTIANFELRGEAEALAQVLNNTLIGRYKTLISAIQEVNLQIGDQGFKGFLRSTLTVVTDAVRVLAGMERRIEGNAEAAYALAFALKVVGGTLVIGGLAAVAVGITAIGSAVLSNPFGLIAIGVGTAVAALIALKDQLITVRGTTATVGDFIQATFEVLSKRIAFLFSEGVLPVVRIVFRYLVIDARQKLEQLFDIFQTVVSGIVTVWNVGISLLPLPLSGFAKIAVGTFLGIGNAIDTAAKGLIEFGTALIGLDISNPISIITVLPKLKDIAFASGDEIKKSFADGFNSGTTIVDFLGNIGATAYESFRLEFDRRAKEKGLPDLSKFFNVSDIFNEINARAGELQSNRQADSLKATGLGIAIAFNAAAAALRGASIANILFADTTSRSSTAYEKYIGQLELEEQRARNAAAGTNVLTGEINAQEVAATRLVAISGQFADGFLNAFRSITNGASSAKDAILSLLDQIGAQLAQIFLLQPLTNSIASFLAPILGPTLVGQAGATAGGGGGLSIPAPPSGGGGSGISTQAVPTVDFSTSNGSGGGGGSNVGFGGPVNIQVMVQGVTDGPSFVRSEHQITTGLARALVRARQQGGR